MTRIIASLLLTSLLLTSHMVYAESHLARRLVSSGGGRVGSGNPMQAITVIGAPGGGLAGGGGITIYVGAPPGTYTLPPGTKIIAVEGTVGDTAATVTVNGLGAVTSGTTFRAEGILLVEGPNTITVTATDRAGNETIRAVTVTLLTHPPARPTVAAAPAVTTATSYTLTGTKTPGTSIWLNGVEVVARDDATTWSITVSLVEGDNVFVITTKDAIGNQSAAKTTTIVVDNLPPVITVTSPGKTNLTPHLLTGMVDDSLTRVEVNGVVVTNTGRNFQREIALVEGANAVTITATSPNGYVTTQSLTITLGTIPAITSVQPADGGKPYAGDALTISVNATDQENDPIECQVLLDGQVLAGWGAAASATWTPTIAQRGLHTIELQARDSFGGSASRQTQVYVVRKPIMPQ